MQTSDYVVVLLFNVSNANLM